MTTLQDLTAALSAPFPSDALRLRPSAFTAANTSAIALPYADVRTYQERLDQAVGPDAWQVWFDLTPVGAVCTLTILGVTKSDVGDFPRKRTSEQYATIAAAQAFKRACAQFGIGRYLYILPTLWVDYDPHEKRFLACATAIAALYEAADLAAYITDATKYRVEQDSQSPANVEEVSATLPSAMLDEEQDALETYQQLTHSSRRRGTPLSSLARRSATS